MAAIKPVIAIVGPTASGKTSLAITLAKQYNGEIICADSRTVYKNLNICTAKPTKAEQAAAQHHLLNIVEVTDTFNVAKFKQLANRAIDKIHSIGKLPIIAGGSGLFIDALLYNYQFSDPNAERDAINPRHVAKSQQGSKSEFRPNTHIVGLKLPKQELDERIAERAQRMIDDGLLDEVAQLSKKYGWDLPAFREPAFKAFRSYLEGAQTREEAKKVFVTQHRQYAKRQMTWFKRNKNIQWVNTEAEAQKIVSKFLNK